GGRGGVRGGPPARGANPGGRGALAAPGAPRAVLRQSTRASPVGAPAPGANNSWLGVLASPFAPGAVLLQSTGASPVGAPAPGANGVMDNPRRSCPHNLWITL